VARRSGAVAVGEVLVWLLFFALLVPAGFAGWAIGHYTKGGTRTITVSAPSNAQTAAPTTTTAAATTAQTTTAQTTTAQATTAQTTTAQTTVSAAAAAAKGKTVFMASGCGACHTFKPAGTTGTIGPDLDTKPATDAKTAHMALAAFVRESIVNPNAYISPGYQKGIMPETFGKQLTKTQLAELVAFVAGAK
jgi:cytochrome c551/c552